MATEDAAGQVRLQLQIALAELCSAEGRLNDVLYWARSAIARAERHLADKKATAERGGVLKATGVDLDLAVAELSIRRERVASLRHLAEKCGVDVTVELAANSDVLSAESA